MRTANRVPTRPRNVEPREYWREGALIDDRYEIGSKLGDGSMGTVYLARDSLLRKAVALKVLHPEVATHKGTVQRFRREVALAHSVTHENVVRIFDAGEAHGLPYLSMEFLRGQTLEELLTQTSQGDIPLSHREIRDILSDILGGLEAVHRAGIIHRDLKPANILLTERGAVVMDFGVAGWSNLLDASADRDQPDSLVRTEVGTILGSPAYMAPELWDRQPATVQSDLFALGVIAYQLLTGRLPYDAKDARNYLYQMRTKAPVPIRQLRRDAPSNIVNFVEASMSTEADRRPPSAEAAMRWIRPLRQRWKRRVGVALATAGVAALAAWWASDSPNHADLGISDPLAGMDFRAAVRSYDIGDYETATRQLDRLAKLEPNSAGIGYMRSAIAHELGDGQAHERACLSQEWQGSEGWRAMVETSCDDQFKTSPDAKLLLTNRVSRFDKSALPRIVSNKLVPQVEAAGHLHPGLRVELQSAEDLLARPPNWNAAALPIPTRWALAEIDTSLARGQLDIATSQLDMLIAANPASPIVISRAAHLAALRGDIESARNLAHDISDADPRPLVRLWLEGGRLETAWEQVERRQSSVYHSALLDMWCGFAVRYGSGAVEERCGELEPGFTRVFARADRSDASPDDLAAMNPVEREMWYAQRSYDRDRYSPSGCVTRTPRPVVIVHARPPFETYLRQLEIGLALCAGRSQSGHIGRAEKLLDELIGVTPNDPFAILARAQFDYSRGRKAAALRESRRVLEIWRHADPGLSFIEAVRAQHSRDGDALDRKVSPGVAQRTEAVARIADFQLELEEEAISGRAEAALERSKAGKKRRPRIKPAPTKLAENTVTDNDVDADADADDEAEEAEAAPFELPDLIDEPQRAQPWSPPPAALPASPDNDSEESAEPAPTLGRAHSTTAASNDRDTPRPAIRHALAAPVGRSPQQAPNSAPAAGRALEPGVAPRGPGKADEAEPAPFLVPRGHGRVAPPS